MVLLATSSYGIGLTPDSSLYISGARNLRDGKGFVDFNDMPLVRFPPLYSVILALCSTISKIDVPVVARYVNAVLYGMIIFFSGIFLTYHAEHIPLYGKIGAIGAILWSISLFHVAIMAWSEPLFIFWVLIFLFYLKRYLYKRTRWTFIVFSSAAALAFLTRYPGMTVVFSGLVVLFFFNTSHLKKRIWEVIVFGFISSAPCGVWMIRNYLFSQTFIGPRSSTIFTLSHNLMLIFRVFLGWFLPESLTLHRSFLILLAGMIGFALGTLNRNHHILWKILNQNIPEIVFTIIYTLFFIISMTITQAEPIGNRYLSPIFVPCILVGVSFVIHLLGVFYEERQKIYQWGFIGLFLLIVIFYPAQMIIHQIDTCRRNGLGGYTTASWLESETIRYLQQHPLSPIVSNNPYGVYLLTKLSAKESPMKTWYNSLERKEELAELAGTWPGTSQAYFVWFHRSAVDYLYTIEELQTIAEFSSLIEFNDGIIYLISPKR